MHIIVSARRISSSSSHTPIPFFLNSLLRKSRWTRSLRDTELRHVSLLGTLSYIVAGREKLEKLPSHIIRSSEVSHPNTIYCVGPQRCWNSRPRGRCYIQAPDATLTHSALTAWHIRVVDTITCIALIITIFKVRLIVRYAFSLENPSHVFAIWNTVCPVDLLRATRARSIYSEAYLLISSLVHCA